MATVTDINPISSHYETYFRINQELKEEKQAHKRLSKEHLWEVIKTALWAIASMVSLAGFIAIHVLIANDFFAPGAGVAFSALLSYGGLFFSPVGWCISNEKKDHVKRSLITKQQTIERLKAESKAIANNIKASA